MGQNVSETGSACGAYALEIFWFDTVNRQPGRVICFRVDSPAEGIDASRSQRKRVRVPDLSSVKRNAGRARGSRLARSRASYCKGAQNEMGACHASMKASRTQIDSGTRVPTAPRPQPNDLNLQMLKKRIRLNEETKSHCSAIRYRRKAERRDFR